MAKVVIGSCPNCKTELRVKEFAVRPIIHHTCRCGWHGQVAVDEKVIRARLPISGGRFTSPMLSAIHQAALGICFFALVATGLFPPHCVTVTIGDTTVYHFARWYAISVASVTGLFLIALWTPYFVNLETSAPRRAANRREKNREGVYAFIALTVLSFVVAVLFSYLYPGLLDKVVVTNEYFEVTTCKPFFLGSNVVRVAFDRLADLEVKKSSVVVVRRGVRNRDRWLYWRERQSTTENSIEEPERLLQHAMDDILHRYRRAGVEPP